MTQPGGGASTGGASDRLHGLDTLRAAAILLVMPYHLIGHFPEALQAPARFGWIGVDLFFVLSGYLIGTQIFRPILRGEPLRFRDFYARRAYRIFPLFFVVLALYVFVPAWREAPGLQPWWQFATFTENLLIDYRRNQAFSHAWSLCVEEHFYLVLPVLTALLVRQRTAAWKVYTLLATVFLLGLGARALVLVHDLKPFDPEDSGFSSLLLEKLYYPTYVRLDGLLAGVSLALLRTFRPRYWTVLARHGHSLATAGMGLVVAATWCMATRFSSVTGKAVVGDLLGYPLLGTGFALLTASALSSNGLLARVRVPGARLLATVAFSLYLTHKEAVHLLLRSLPDAPDESYWMLPVYFAACFVVAGVLYVAVERPFLRLREARARRNVTTPAVDLQARVDPAL